MSDDLKSPEPTENVKNVGDKIMQFLEDNELSQNNLSFLLDRSESYVSYIISGSRVPSLEVICRIHCITKEYVTFEDFGIMAKKRWDATPKDLQQRKMKQQEEAAEQALEELEMYNKENLDFDSERLSAKIREYVRKKGISQRQFASTIGIQYSYFNSIVHKRIKLSMRKAYQIERETQNQITIEDFGFKRVDLTSKTLNMGVKLKHWIAKSDISNARFAQKIGISPSNISHILLGSQVPSKQICRKIYLTTNRQVNFFQSLMDAEKRRSNERLAEISAFYNDAKRQVAREKESAIC